MRPFHAASACVGLAILSGIILVGRSAVPEGEWRPGLPQPADAQVQEPGPSAAPPPVPRRDGLTREAPRAPLSELSLALPPKPRPPPPPEQWRGAILFQPVASAAGRLFAMGHDILLDGIEVPDADEICTFENRTWPCGMQARTAFRAYLRGRAVRCRVPSEPDPQMIRAECTVGGDDVAHWLVASGWARPTPGGAYADAGREAADAKRGLFGPP